MELTKRVSSFILMGTDATNHVQRATGVIPLCERSIGQVHRETGGASVVPKTDRLPKSDFLCFCLFFKSNVFTYISK